MLRDSLPRRPSLFAVTVGHRGRPMAGMGPAGTSHVVMGAMVFTSTGAPVGSIFLAWLGIKPISKFWSAQLRAFNHSQGIRQRHSRTVTSSCRRVSKPKPKPDIRGRHGLAQRDVPRQGPFTVVHATAPYLSLPETTTWRFFPYLQQGIKKKPSL